MGIRFDSAGAMAELKQNIVVAMKQLQSEFLNEVRSNMRTPEGADSMYEGDVEVLANIISAQVIGGADAAMDNYGVGSEMASPSENRGLLDYMDGPLWNDDRHDTHVRSRARGGYTDIYGNHRKSASNIGGIDLENRKRKDGSMPWAPREPSFALETAARWMENGRFQEVLAQAVAATNFGKYMVEER